MNNAFEIQGGKKLKRRNNPAGRKKRGITNYIGRITYRPKK
jgi:hypothetical protein